MSDDFDIVLIFAFSAVVFMYVIFCLFGYSKSGFWQTFVFIDAINKSKSRAMMNHLLILNSHARTLGTTINETVQAIGY